MATQATLMRAARPNSVEPNGAGGMEARHPWTVVDGGKDYFVERDGLRFAGMHLLLDLWDASELDNLDVVERALCEAAEVAGATILHVHLHHFSPNGGISGVVVLAESHISIHTWPERRYAALDVFMCGACDPYRAIPVLARAFKAQDIRVNEHRRGLVAPSATMPAKG